MSVVMQRSSVKAVGTSARVCVATPRLAVVARPRHAVAARATSQDDPSVKVQEQLNEAASFVKTKWQQTADAEKPAAIAIIVGAVIAQIAIGATVDAVDRLPLIHQFLEFVGLAVTSVYGYRYITDPAEREGVKKSLESFVEAVTGKNPK